MGRKDADDLRQSFRSTRGQDQIAQQDAPRSKKRPVDNSVDNVDNSKRPSIPTRSKTFNQRKSFLEKYHNIELRIDDFTPYDLMQYFKEISHKNKHNYVVANMNRDIGIMKRALKDRSAREICAMIEFIFESGQKYIEVAKAQPTVLTHSISNRIYADMCLWVDDQYVPEEPKTAKSSVAEQISKREYQSVPGKKSSINSFVKIRRTLDDD